MHWIWSCVLKWNMSVVWFLFWFFGLSIIFHNKNWTIFMAFAIWCWCSAAERAANWRQCFARQLSHTMKCKQIECIIFICFDSIIINLLLWAFIVIVGTRASLHLGFKATRVRLAAYGIINSLNCLNSFVNALFFVSTMSLNPNWEENN